MASDKRAMMYQTVGLQSIDGTTQDSTNGSIIRINRGHAVTFFIEDR